MAGREQLYHDYVNELKMFNPNLIFVDAASIFKQYKEVSQFPDLTWIDIYDGVENVGFILLTNGSHCPVTYDWFIMECYIDQAHRRKGLMTQAMKNVIRKYDGTFGMFILAANKQASEFWDHFMKSESKPKHTLYPNQDMCYVEAIPITENSVPTGTACYERAFVVRKGGNLFPSYT